MRALDEDPSFFSSFVSGLSSGCLSDRVADASLTTPPSVNSGRTGELAGTAAGSDSDAGASSATAPNGAFLSSALDSGSVRREYLASDSPGRTSIGPVVYVRGSDRDS